MKVLPTPDEESPKIMTNASAATWSTWMKFKTKSYQITVRCPKFQEDCGSNYWCSGNTGVFLICCGPTHPFVYNNNISFYLWWGVGGFIAALISGGNDEIWSVQWFLRCQRLRTVSYPRILLYNNPFGISEPTLQILLAFLAALGAISS